MAGCGPNATEGDIANVTISYTGSFFKELHELYVCVCVLCVCARACMCGGGVVVVAAAAAAAAVGILLLRPGGRRAM